MSVDTFRATFTYVIAVLVLIGGFYSLVLYPYDLDDLVKGAIIGFMSAAISFVFGQEIAKATALSTTRALQTSVEPPYSADSGLLRTTTTTVRPDPTDPEL